MEDKKFMSSKYVYGVLLFFVMLLKAFLVFSEVVLVLLAFSIFVYLLSSYGSEMISNELDSRKDKISEEFDLYKNLQEKTFSHLISYHKKQKLLSSEIRDILEISKSEIVNVEKYYENLLQNQIVFSLDDRLKRISINENKANVALQRDIFVNLKDYLVQSYLVDGEKMSRKNRKELLKSCIRQLETSRF